MGIVISQGKRRWAHTVCFLPCPAPQRHQSQLEKETHSLQDRDPKVEAWCPGSSCESWRQRRESVSWEQFQERASGGNLAIGIKTKP